MVSTNRPRDFELIFWTSPLTCHNPDGEVKGGGPLTLSSCIFFNAALILLIKPTFQRSKWKRILLKNNRYSQKWGQLPQAKKTSLIPTPYNRSDEGWPLCSLTFKLSFWVFSFTNTNICIKLKPGKTANTARNEVNYLKQKTIFNSHPLQQITDKWPVYNADFQGLSLLFLLYFE